MQQTVMCSFLGAPAVYNFYRYRQFVANIHNKPAYQAPQYSLGARIWSSLTTYTHDFCLLVPY